MLPRCPINRVHFYQLYGPQGLTMRSGMILDTEGLPRETLEQLGLERGASRRTGRQRPLLVEYGWNERN